jgi:hypothetical protein
MSIYSFQGLHILDVIFFWRRGREHSLLRSMRKHILLAFAEPTVPRCLLHGGVPLPYMNSTPFGYMLRLKTRIYLKRSCGTACIRSSPPTPYEFESLFRLVHFVHCGEGGIRTLGTISRTQSFQDCLFDRSSTSP